MQIVIFFGFSIIYMHIYLANAESEYRVKVLSNMFTYPGWRHWDIDNYVHIIHRWININENFESRYLLATDIHGRVVNDENIEHKSLQAHQFLSCKYAQVLKEFCEYERGMNTACSKIDNGSKFLSCLKDLQKMLRKSDKLIMRMRGSLSCFHQLSPQYPFNKEVFEILGDFKYYYYKNEFLFTTQVTAYVEEKMLLTVKRLNLFYNNCCWPIPYGEEDGELSYEAERVQRMFKERIPEYVADDLKGVIKKNIDLFVKYFDERFGFKYDVKSKITSLMYDPDLLRIIRMNKLLASPGWLALSFLEIKLPWYRRKTVKELLTSSADDKIVNKVNIDVKVQHAYQFLTCKYALTLKRCCDYVRFIWTQYNSSINLPDPTTHWEKFENIIMKSEPLVSSMQDALSHFYRLSPHIECSSTVYYILERFKTKMFRETVSNDVINRNLDIETEITNILQRLSQFYKRNCFPEFLFHETFFDEHAKVKLSNLEEDFIQEIDILKKSNYKDFGFLFHTIGRMKNLSIAEESP